MNKKGFTLIELLMVIAIIALLSMVLVPNVVVLINKNNDNSCKSLEKNIISSAKTYVSENKYVLGFKCDNVAHQIKLQQLVDGGFLTEPVVNPITKSNVSLSEAVAVTYNCNTKTFDYSFSLGC